MHCFELYGWCGLAVMIAIATVGSGRMNVLHHYPQSLTPNPKPLNLNRTVLLGVKETMHKKSTPTTKPLTLQCFCVGIRGPGRCSWRAQPSEMYSGCRISGFRVRGFGVSGFRV